MNKKIKVIDLLNMIAEGKEAPEKIKYNGEIYHTDNLEYFYVDDDRNALLITIFDDWSDYDGLMERIEIIEEDNNKIENLPKWATTREDKEYTKQEDHILVVAQKVDEIIDRLNNME